MKEQVKKTKTIEEQLTSQKIAKAASKAGVYTFLGVMALLMIIPFYWMLATSLKSLEEIMRSTPTLFPESLRWSNYVDVFKEVNLGRYILNTLIVSGASTFIGTFLSIALAFALSRLNFKGREVIFMILLATMMIPGEMMVLTNYITVSNFGWVNTGSGSKVAFGPYYAMVIPFLVSIFHVYLLRNTFKQIPNELYYAAKVDGTSDWKYLWKVMVPMAKSSIITIVILKLMGAWNSYVWPNLVAGGNEKLITNGLRDAFTDAGTGMTQQHLQMAATVIVTLPLLLLFIFFRKYIMSGVSRSGIKG